MASVFKLGRDKRKKNSCWYFEYKDAAGKKRMKKGFTDKGLTEQLAVKFEMDVRARVMGLIDAELEELAAKRKCSLKEFVEGFRKSLRAKKNTDKHVKLAMSRIECVITGCGFRTLGDLKAESVEHFMIDLKERDDLGHRTYNHYLQAVESFGRWLVARRHLERNPVAGIPRLNAETDVRHARRALTADEVSKLINVAKESDTHIQCFSGADRARIYLLSYLTGLRKGEIASLTRRSFELDGSQPTVTVQAGASKHRRKDVLPLHPELVAMLRAWLPELSATDVLFPKLARRKTWLMVQKDLEAAGIPYKTEAGIADFHAAGRHTHITELFRSGASLVEARALARHGDVRMTMRYTHIGMADQAKAVGLLPAPCQDIVRKSGVAECPEMSADAIAQKEHTTDWQTQNPGVDRGYGVSRHEMSGDGKEPSEWRRRELNPHAILNQAPMLLQLPSNARHVALQWRCIPAEPTVFRCHRSTLNCRP